MLDGLYMVVMVFRGQDEMFRPLLDGILHLNLCTTWHQISTFKSLLLALEGADCPCRPSCPTMEFDT